MSAIYMHNPICSVFPNPIGYARKGTYPAAEEAAAVPVSIRSCAVASKLVKTTSPASNKRFRNGLLFLGVEGRRVLTNAVSSSLSKASSCFSSEAEYSFVINSSILLDRSALFPDGLLADCGDGADKGDAVRPGTGGGALLVPTGLSGDIETGEVTTLVLSRGFRAGMGGGCFGPIEPRREGLGLNVSDTFL